MLQVKPRKVTAVVRRRFPRFFKRTPKPQQVMTLRDCFDILRKDFRPHAPHRRR